MLPDTWEYRYRAARSDKPREDGDDGDTVLMLLDLGMCARSEEAIRLHGVFAPERKQFGGAEVSMFTAEVFGEVEERFRAGRRRWPFVVQTERVAGRYEAGEVRSFVRYVGHVWARDTGEYLNDTIAQFIASHPEWGRGTGAKAAYENG